MHPIHWLTILGAVGLFALIAVTVVVVVIGWSKRRK